MPSRKRPCQYCRKRRRKCDKPSSSEPCKLCHLKGVRCTPIAPSYNHYVDPDCQEQMYYHHAHGAVVQLREDLESLEKELAAFREPSQQHMRWQLQFKNGQLSLLSQIKSLQEFLVYGKAALSYLSPFRDIMSASWPQNQTSFLQPAIQQLLQNEQSHPCNRLTILNDASDTLVWRAPQRMMFPLINHYFKCCNATLPILHENSYRKHLASLIDPLQDPVVNAICASACISQCKHAFLTSREKRRLGEYYFQQSTELLLDIFDDIDKRLDTLLTINLLQPFMLATLRVSESKKWNTIGIAIALDLTRQPVTVCTYLDRVRQAIIARNRILIFVSAHTLDFYAEGKCIDIPAVRLKFDILPDDCDRTKETLEVINCISQFLFCPSYIRIANHVRAMSVGRPAEIRLEDVVYSEEAILSWWQQLPNHLKLSDTLNSFTQDLVHGCGSILKLTIAISSLILIMSIETALLSSISVNQQQHGAQTSFYQRAFETMSYSVDTSILIIRQLDRLGFCSSPVRLLAKMMDYIASLVSHHRSAESEKLKLRMKELMLEFKKYILPDHQVRMSESPYSILTIASSTDSKMPAIAELYQNYPLPAEAMLFDILQTTVHKLSTLCK